MANGYMPRKDREALAWMRVFVGGLAERPGVYKVAPEELQAVTAAVAVFEAAFLRTAASETRTAVAVAAKDDARAAAELACRPIYARIKIDPTIDSPDMLRIGVRPPNPARTRIAAPSDAPFVVPVADLGHTHVIHYGHADHNGSAKPRGIAAIQIFRRLTPPAPGRSGSAPGSPAPGRGRCSGPLEYVGTFTRNPIRIPQSQKEDLRTASYTARWITRRGLTGPWSHPLDMRINCTAPNLGAIDITSPAMAA